MFKEEEEAVKVELHEGCGRIKLYWTMALADFRTLKGMVEFREAGSGKRVYYYCYHRHGSFGESSSRVVLHASTYI